MNAEQFKDEHDTHLDMVELMEAYNSQVLKEICEEVEKDKMESSDYIESKHVERYNLALSNTLEIIKKRINE